MAVFAPADKQIQTRREMIKNVIITEYHVPHGIGVLNSDVIHKVSTCSDFIAIAGKNGVITLFKAEIRNENILFQRLASCSTRLATCFLWMNNQKTNVKLFCGTSSGTVDIFRVSDKLQLIHEQLAHSSADLGITEWHLAESGSRCSFYQSTKKM